MANHNLPSLVSTYSNFVAELDARLDDISKMFDVAGAINIPTNTIRWDSTLLTWRKWSGTSWEDLSNNYNINVTGVGNFSSLNTTGNITVGGNLTVNGTVTTVNSTTVSIDDKNIELGSVTTPTNTTADGGGITLRGTTDKTFNWINSTSAWTSSEHVDLISGKEYKINGTVVLNATQLGSGITSSSLNTLGTITTGTWQATTIAPTYGGTGQTTYSSGELLIGTSLGGLAKSTLTAGTGISITNGSGSITIASNLGTISVSNGGTGQTSYSDGQLLIGNSATGLLNKTTLTAGTGISITNGNGTISIANSGITSFNGTTGAVTGVSSITGTTNQIVASASTGAVTLSLPQNISTVSGVQFGSIGVGTGSSGVTGEVRATGDITAFYSTSDIRLKENIRPLDSVLDKIDSIGAYYFNYKSKPNKISIGIIAQELLKYYPELVYETKPFEANSNLETIYAVRYELLTVVLLKAIKELNSKIDSRGI